MTQTKTFSLLIIILYDLEHEFIFQDKGYVLMQKHIFWVIELNITFFLELYFVSPLVSIQIRVASILFNTDFNCHPRGLSCNIHIWIQSIF